MSYPLKYPDGFGELKILLPTPLLDRVSKLAHDRSKVHGRRVSKSEILQEFVRQAFENFDRADRANQASLDLMRNFDDRMMTLYQRALQEAGSAA